MESQEIDLNKVNESGEEKESFELWKVPLKKGGDVLKFEEGTYKVLFKNDGEKVEGKFGEQVELLVEGWDVSTEEKFDGVWFVPISEYKKSLYGQLQKFRGENPLHGRIITLQVSGKGSNKRYKILEVKE